MARQWIRPHLYALENRLYTLGLTYINPHRRSTTFALRPEFAADAAPDAEVSFAQQNSRMLVILTNKGSSWHLLKNGCIRHMGNYYRKTAAIPARKGFTNQLWDPMEVPGTNGFLKEQHVVSDAIEQAGALASAFFAGKVQPGTQSVCKSCPNEALCLLDDIKRYMT